MAALRVGVQGREGCSSSRGSWAGGRAQVQGLERNTIVSENEVRAYW